MIVGARQGVLSISETDDLLGFSHATFCREFFTKNKITSSEQEFCGHKCLVNERVQRTRARLVEAGRKVTNAKV